MNNLKLAGLGIVAVLLSVVVGEYAFRSLNTILFVNIAWNGNDGPLIMYALLLGFVGRPLIADMCAAVIVLVGWHITTPAVSGSRGTKVALATSVFLATTVLAIVWTAWELALNRFWP